ncbi:hypothetical protein F8388_000952 [Cannabis sativa]|uniref:Alliinase C-terminal domain-containing protein n=1 Tax=Cannabis sativa TaxID=3483 RepID=A0A7J6FQ60_CANSA|nr:hypothetical protein F8388_000952 [Cannabis sativa]
MNEKLINLVFGSKIWQLYKQQTEFFQEVEYKFEEDASLWMKKMNNCSNDDNIIEIVTSPNNPDGKLNRARLQHPNAKAIYDRVYYWPQFTPISAPADDDIMLFSLSKLTGKKEEDEEETMFDFGYKTMRNRWEKLNEIISVSKRFSLQELESDQYWGLHQLANFEILALICEDKGFVTWIT